MKSKYFIALFVFVFLALSCNKQVAINDSPGLADETNPFSQDSLDINELYQLISGKWKWDYSIIMSRNIHYPENMITPANAGYTMTYDFKSGSAVDFYKNNELFETHYFEIKQFKVLPDDEGPVTEILIDGAPLALRFFHPDTMLIGNGWLDGVDGFYSRINE